MGGGVLWNFGEGEARGMERETGERKGGRGISFILLFGNFILILSSFM